MPDHEAAGVMQWTVQLKARTSAGEVNTTELVTFSRPGVVSTLAEIGLMLDKTRVLQVRAAVLDGHFGHQAIQLAA